MKMEIYPSEESLSEGGNMANLQEPPRAKFHPKEFGHHYKCPYAGAGCPINKQCHALSTPEALTAPIVVLLLCPAQKGQEIEVKLGA